MNSLRIADPSHSENEEFPPSPISYIDQDDMVEIDDFYDPDHPEDELEDRRQGRKDDAHDFRCRFTYGSASASASGFVSKEHKTFICPGGTHDWEDKSSGTIWIGVHGLDSICVVTRTGDLDVTRVRRNYKHLTLETVLRKFRKTVISEIEDFASPSSKLCTFFGPGIPKPFGVVSVIPCADNGHKERLHEALSDESEEDGECSQMARRIKALLKKYKEREKKERMKYAEYEKTIEFLQEQMRMDATFSKTVQASSTEYDETVAINFLLEKMTKMSIEAFTVDEVIKIAISAFQHLFQKEFKANEIEVTVMDPTYYVSKEAKYQDIYVKELETSEIQFHLDAIKETRCCKNGGFL